MTVASAQWLAVGSRALRETDALDIGPAHSPGAKHVRSQSAAAPRSSWLSATLLLPGDSANTASATPVKTYAHSSSSASTESCLIVTARIGSDVVPGRAAAVLQSAIDWMQWLCVSLAPCRLSNAVYAGEGGRTAKVFVQYASGEALRDAERALAHTALPQDVRVSWTTCSLSSDEQDVLFAAEPADPAPWLITPTRRPGADMLSLEPNPPGGQLAAFGEIRQASAAASDSIVAYIEGAASNAHMRSSHIPDVDANPFLVAQPGLASQDAAVDLEAYFRAPAGAPHGVLPPAADLGVLYAEDAYASMADAQQAYDAALAALQHIAAAREYEIDYARVASGADTRTTCMIRNIPNKYTQQMLIDMLDASSRAQYDFFVYLRMDFKNRCNVGYAFVNFASPEAILPFAAAYVGRHWPRFNSDKICHLTYARIQGKAALLDKFRHSRVMAEPASYRPRVFYSDEARRGQEEPFP